MTGPDTRTQFALSGWAWPLISGAVALAAYLATRSASLDDFDSYSFVLALRQFDLVLQQPQPPGFPVYVALGRLLALAFADPRVALTTLSAMGGAAAVSVVCRLGQMLTRRSGAAALAALLFALLPIQWLTSAKALSDAPGLAFSLAALALVWAGQGDDRRLASGAALLGLSLGVRPQANLPGLLLLAWVVWDKARTGKWRALALAAGAGLAGVLVWLVPVVVAAGGVGPYRAILAAHSQHVWHSDALFALGPVTGVTLRARTLDFLQTLLMPLLGVDVYGPFGLAQAVQVAALAAFLAGGIALAGWRRRETWLLAAWVLVILVPLFLLESLNRPRLALPLLPPLVLLAAGGWLRTTDRALPGASDAPPGGSHPLQPAATSPLQGGGKTERSEVRRGFLPAVHSPHAGLSLVRWAVVGLAALAMLAESAPLAYTLATVPAPPAQAAAAVRADYPPNETLVAAAGSFRAAQVELPGYRLLYRYEWDEAAARAAAGSGSYHYIVVLDREVFGDVMDSLDGGGRYVPVVDRTFTRSPRVHTQHDQVRLQVLAPADSLGPAELELPADGLIDIGGPDDGRFIGSGWFRTEDVGGASARWAGDGLVSTLRVYLPPGAGYAVTLRAAAFPAGQTLTVQVNGHRVAQLPLVQDWAEYAFVIEPAMLPDHSPTLIELAHGQAVSAYELTGGGSPDQRSLAAAYDWVRFELR